MGKNGQFDAGVGGPDPDPDLDLDTDLDTDLDPDLDTDPDLDLDLDLDLDPDLDPDPDPDLRTGRSRSHRFARRAQSYWGGSRRRDDLRAAASVRAVLGARHELDGCSSAPCRCGAGAASSGWGEVGESCVPRWS
jgi:hypothetical protein